MMATVWVIPLKGNPIFFNECPRGTQVGHVHMRWAELKYVRAEGMRDGELHCSCADSVTCCSYSVDRVSLESAAEQVRLTGREVTLRTTDGHDVLVLRPLELRKHTDATHRHVARGHSPMAHAAVA